MKIFRVKKNLIQHIIELIKWIISIILLILVIIYNYIYQDIQLIYRNILVSFLFLLMLLSFSTTKKGKKIFVFIQNTRMEIRKVFWPTYLETIQITIIIFIIATIMFSMLWLLDHFLIYLLSFCMK
ncbi:preprotein translocase subunit SecE [Enterobacteriaceae endosymbiont of Neohaemonia nigricornis]|uniref:preprotein translocase subunit SecE n=1 Tax=Enterobacteriaceae endosymbiont of Neohaemonia nigricornis TaxID=2675792 RepID=UPI00144A29BB|nr:preprotein translocase subunit SecE [Enterobacteriaceae endosymbiont of Neohaemonia nigricornis]QJC30510.1 preprotein translocase subunit SecE [Enterobacteriaceae endosymbiont of Neohaemonia nigricornis]